jgi:HAD superfamily hydrolase (TIGR01450 family)
VTLASRYDLVIFDLDGVVYLGVQAVAGAPSAIRAVVEAGTPVVFATNNASRQASEVAELLTRLEVPATPEDVVTSAQATAELLAEDLPAGAPILVVGAPALQAEIAAVGLTPVESADARPVAVVQGYGPQVGWPLLAEACVAIRAGAQWIATNMDTTMPSPRGPVPGNGSLIAALVAALGGRTPDTVVGKPEPLLFTTAARHRGAERVLVVGDRLDTDIEGAGRAGMDSLLVLTGVSTAADLLAAPAHQRPTHVAADCQALSSVDDASRVPEWCDGAASVGAWRVVHDADHLVLSTEPERGRDDAVAALRALARAAWVHPEWTGIKTVDPAAEAAVSALGLGRFAAWSAASGGPA